MSLLVTQIVTESVNYNVKVLLGSFHSAPVKRLPITDRRKVCSFAIKGNSKEIKIGIWSNNVIEI